MGVAGVLVNALGGRAVWALAGIVYLVGALVALALTRRLPVSTFERRRPPDLEPLVPDGSAIVERINAATGEPARTP